MSEEIKKRKMSFFSYLAKMQNPQKVGITSIQIDTLLITLFTQMQGINITVIHGNGVWATDENTLHTVVLVYLGNGEFIPTKKCKNKSLISFTLHTTFNECCNCITITECV